MSRAPEPSYSPRLDEAIALATDAFRYRIRKGSRTPYLAHLFQVMVHVAEHGGDEDQMIAAILHDYLEDIETSTEQELEVRFGSRVSSMVMALSDCTTYPKPPWQERKEKYIAALRLEGPEVRLISAADKLHNARSILRDLVEVGERVWDQFAASRSQTLWYYREMTKTLSDGWSHPLLTELEQVVRELHSRAGESYE